MKRYVMNSVHMFLLWFVLFMVAAVLWRLFAPLVLVFFIFWLVRRIWRLIVGVVAPARQTPRPRAQTRAYRPDKMVIDVESRPAGSEDATGR